MVLRKATTSCAAYVTSYGHDTIPREGGTTYPHPCLQQCLDSTYGHTHTAAYSPRLVLTCDSAHEGTNGYDLSYLQYELRFFFRLQMTDTT